MESPIAVSSSKRPPEHTCPQCKSTETLQDSSSGKVYCTSCGYLIEECSLQNETTFNKDESGHATVNGNFNSFESLGQENERYQSQLGHRHYRKIVEYNAQNEMEQVCYHLGVKNLTEIAIQHFKRAVSEKMTRGRKIKQIIGACLYLACRQLNEPFMMIDFADELDIDVFHLNNVYQKLADLLKLNIYTVDPTIYIERFVNKLDCKEKSDDVREMAVRLVKRMKRDWLDRGRRPTGLCGAAILLAAKAQDFQVYLKDIERIAKVGKSTIKKRLVEFENTDCSDLSIDQFNKYGNKIEDYGQDANPPSFTKKLENEQISQQEIIEKRNRFEKQIDKVLIKNANAMNGQVDVDNNPVIAGMSKLATIIDNNIEKSRKFGQSKSLDESSNVSEEPPIKKTKSTFSENQAINLFTNAIVTPDKVTNLMKTGNVDHRHTEDELNEQEKLSLVELNQLRPSLEDFGVEKSIEEQFQNAPKIDDYKTIIPDPNPDKPVFRANIEPENTVPILHKSITQLKAEGAWPVKNEPVGESFSDISDSEIDQYILCEQDKRVKTMLWERENGEVYAQVLERQKKKFEEIEKKKIEAERMKNSGIRPRKRRVANKNYKNTGIAIAEVIKTKKISHKINYDVLVKNLSKSSKNDKNKSLSSFNKPNPPRQSHPNSVGQITSIKPWTPATPDSVNKASFSECSTEESSEDEDIMDKFNNEYAEASED